MPWNPQQYDKFKTERTAPVNDLLSLLHVKPNLSVIDLGCGTGEHTSTLASLLPDSNVLGIDNSADMLTMSAQYEREGLRFEQCNFENIVESYDVIFSNAALQWGSHHEELFPTIWSHLLPGGQMLIQMPKNQDHLSHRLARDLALGEFSHCLSDDFIWRITNQKEQLLNIEQYAELLFSLGAEDINVFLKVYSHTMKDSSAIVEWVKGTLLIPYMEQISTADEREHFLSRYSKILHQNFPSSPVLYTFKRILISAMRPNR